MLIKRRKFKKRKCFTEKNHWKNTVGRKKYVPLEEKKSSMAMRQKENIQNGSHIKCFHLCLKKKRKLLKCNSNDKKNEIFRNKLNQRYKRLIC